MTPPVKICIIANQVLSAQKIGGFGSMTKKLALSLAACGFQVVVAVPQGKGAQTLEGSGGFTTLPLSTWDMLNPQTFKRVNADIYHSQHQTIMSAVAMLAEPHKRHVVTCRDPRDLHDWLIELRYATWPRRWKIPLN